MRSIIAEISAVANSRRIAAFAEGVEATLPDGERLTIKVKASHRSTRSPGLRLAKHSYVTEVEAGVEVGFGYGESESQLLSFQKSIVEGVERAVYKAMKARNPEILTSNGWAAHVDSRSAGLSALEELCERDAVLTHWLCEKPFSEVDVLGCPKWISKWAKDELAQHPRFSRFRVLISTDGHIPVVMTLLQSKTGHALMSQATAPSLEVAIYKALTETCRIGELELVGRFRDSSLNLAQGLPADTPYLPVDHAMVYAYHLPVPQWLFGSNKSWRDSAAVWVERYQAFQQKPVAAEFHTIVSGPITVGFCTSHEVQSLFFGRTIDADKQGLLNRRRLGKVRQLEGLCLLPHCVP